MNTSSPQPGISCSEIDRQWQANRSGIIDRFVSGEESFLPGLLPSTALRMPVGDVVSILTQRHGMVVLSALSAGGEYAAPEPPQPTASRTATSPVAHEPDPGWIKRANVVGINVRTIGSFWRVVHYCLTIPSTINAVHLLPVWEPGVVGSLYGMASWVINPEFHDAELERDYPALDTPAKQLRAVVDVLHAGGRAVGMDVIPHTDRFSEIVLATPSLFEWLRRDERQIIDHRAELHTEVEDLVYQFAAETGPAAGALGGTHVRLPPREQFFGAAFSENDRTRYLFGDPGDRDLRNARRAALIRFVHAAGYEPVPATMAPPYRGMEVDPESGTVDSSGDSWLDYRITKPQAMSRVFGPLTRYKLYDRKADNGNWEIDFDHPRESVWNYMVSHYADVQRQFGFDFMRGDMSHVQMRPDGVPAAIPDHYDPFATIKAHIQRSHPSFAYFAETFMSPPGVMAYGSELDHLEASRADATLGDLQSVPVASDEFIQRLRQYLDVADARSCTPCLTIMTADKDDPRFDSFYRSGNELRLFLGLFLPHMPSYVALGFELRDPHPTPVDNEFYSKLYVFQVKKGKHATTGPYRFGSNAGLFLRLQRIHRFAETVLPQVNDDEPLWLLPPDATAGSRTLAWALPLPDNRNALICVCNCDTVAAATNVRIPLRPAIGPVELLFSTIPEAHISPPTVCSPEYAGGFLVPRLGRGEGRIYHTPLPMEAQ